MTHKNIGYHTRAASDNTVKLNGGSFGGSLDAETVERLTRLFTVRVKPSGRCVFVDSKGREVSLYVTVDPDKTDAGREALRLDRIRREEAARPEQERRQEALDALDDMSTEELAALLALRNSQQ